MRVGQRRNHKTLKGDDDPNLKFLQIMFVFINLFKNNNMQDSKLESLGFDKILRIDFSTPGCIENLKTVHPMLLDVFINYT